MNIREYSFIIFGTEHGNPLGLVRSLGEYGIAPIGILLRGQERIASCSRYWKVCHLVDSTEEGFALLMDRYTGEERKAFLFTTDDGITDFLNDRYEQVKPYFYFNSSVHPGALHSYMDKANLLRLAEKHGLKTARYWEVARGTIPEDLTYPVITKPGRSYTGDWKSEMVICHNEEELRTAYESIGSARIVLQQYVDKKNEMTLEGLTVQEGRKSAVAVSVSFLHLTADSYGRYLTVGQSPDPELEQKIFAMLEEIGYEGLFEAEFLVGQNGERYFLEINFRSSLWNYAATVAGIPLPVVWAQAMLEPEKLEELCGKTVEPFTAMDELNDLRNRVLTREISFGKWLSEFRGCKCRFYLGRRDPVPMVSMVFGSVGRKLKRMIHR